MHEQILQSQRTIALVSQHYLNSEQCMKELVIAINQGGRRLVVVLLKDSILNQLSTTGPIIKSYFQTCDINILKYDDGSPEFYKKMVRCLPEKKIEEPNTLV